MIHSLDSAIQLLNNWARTFSRLFYSNKMPLLALLGLFTTEVTDFLTLSYTLTSKIPTLSYWPEAGKKKDTHFGRIHPVHIGHHREYPRIPGSWVADTLVKGKPQWQTSEGPPDLWVAWDNVSLVSDLFISLGSWVGRGAWSGGGGGQSSEVWVKVCPPPRHANTDPV